MDLISGGVHYSKGLNVSLREPLMLSAKISVRYIQKSKQSSITIIVDNLVPMYRVWRSSPRERRQTSADSRGSERVSRLMAVAGGSLQGGRVPVRRCYYQFPMASHCGSLFSCVSSIHCTSIQLLFIFNFDAIPLIFFRHSYNPSNKKSRI